MSQNDDQDELDQEIIENLESNDEIKEEDLQEAINNFTFHIPDAEPAHLHLLKKNQFKLDSVDYSKLEKTQFDKVILDKFRW